VTSTPTLRIVIVDDEALVRAGLRLLIENQTDLDVVGEAANGREAINVVGRTSADVVLMDIRMPVVDGLTAARHVLALDHPPSVIMLTTFGEDEYVYEALRMGASGFLLKTSPPEALLDAIRLVAQGQGLIDPAVTMRVIEAFSHRRPTRESSDVLSALTPRELEVLRLIARGLNNSEIAQELVVSHATVKTHVNRILMKLHLRDRTQAVVLAYETGVVQLGA
jgi:DNA-binding NarL/FixJ family response regulator